MSADDSPQVSPPARLLWALVEDAMSKQDLHVQDQLRAAHRGGDITFVCRWHPEVGGPALIAIVDGRELLAVDLRILFPQGDPEP